MSYQRTVIVTGGSSGIGLFCVKKLAEDASTQVVIGSRLGIRVDGQTAPKEPLPANCVHRPLDLLSRASVREFAAAAPAPVAALVCNAGLQCVGAPQYAADGVERTVAANHVGHALLFFLLAARGALAPDCRVVVVGSGTHDPEEPMIPLKPVWLGAEATAKAEAPALQNGDVRYATSKICNVMWAHALAARAQDAGKHWTVNSFDPGFCPGNGSQLSRERPAIQQFLVNNVIPRVAWIFQKCGMAVSTAEHSGQTLAALATSDALAGVTDKYFQIDVDGIKPSSKDSLNVDYQRDLWDWTLGAVAEDDGERAKFAQL